MFSAVHTKFKLRTRNFRRSDDMMNFRFLAGLAFLDMEDRNESFVRRVGAKVSVTKIRVQKKFAAATPLASLKAVRGSPREEIIPPIGAPNKNAKPMAKP